jgi:hypothetical protein
LFVEAPKEAVIMDVKTAIDTGDAPALRGLLRDDRSRADEIIQWDKCLTHPLHYVSDMLFTGVLQKGKELPLIDALIEAGADLNFQKDRRDGKKSDTPLIGAASLGAEDAGIRLLDAGAKPELRGLFGETALYWAALLGEDRLAARLIESSNLNLKDEKYKSSPLGGRSMAGATRPPGTTDGSAKWWCFWLPQAQLCKADCWNLTACGPIR